jgi:protein-S-isoprenylcysteine O-methyltransferase Ste14
MAIDLAGPQVEGTGKPGVIARPPLIFLAILILGFVMDHLVPLWFPISRIGVAHWISAMIAGGMVLVGLGLVTAGIRNFSQAPTPVRTTRAAQMLVTTGIHGYTRNPIYLGMFLVYAGIGLVVRSPWVLILMLPLALTIRYGVVMREEAYLEQRFGDAYRAYKARVRRWL